MKYIIAMAIPNDMSIVPKVIPTPWASLHPEAELLRIPMSDGSRNVPPTNNINKGITKIPILLFGRRSNML
jgi:hypothetical protein